MSQLFEWALCVLVMLQNLNRQVNYGVITSAPSI